MKKSKSCFAFNFLILLSVSFTIVCVASNNLEELYDENISFISELKESLKSKDYDVQIDALAQIRALISTHKNEDEEFDGLNETLDEIVESRILPILIDCLHSKSSEVQERAAWILTHISIYSPHHAKEVVNAGGISPLIYLIDSNNLAMKEETLWALQAIVHRSKKDRDLAVSQGMISKIVKLVMFDKIPANIEQRVADLIKAILVHREVSVNALNELLPAIKKLLDSQNDEVINEILQSMFFAVNGDEISQLFFNHGIPEKLVPFLESENSKFRAIALPVIGNLCYKKPEKFKIFLDLGILKFIPKLLNQEDTRENALMFIKAVESFKEELGDYEINEMQNLKVEL